MAGHLDPCLTAADTVALTALTIKVHRLLHITNTTTVRRHRQVHQPSRRKPRQDLPNLVARRHRSPRSHSKAQSITADKAAAAADHGVDVAVEDHEVSPWAARHHS